MQLLHNNLLFSKEFYLTVYCGHLKNLTLLDIFVNNDTALRTARHTEQDDNTQRERKTARPWPAHKLTKTHTQANFDLYRYGPVIK